MKKIGAFIIIILVCIFLYGRYIEPNSLIIKEYSINTNKIPKSFENLKIVHFSDLLYNKDTKKLKKLENIINKLDADIIVFTGDLFAKNFNYQEKDYNDLKSFLSSLNANLYKYSIIGEEDEVHLDIYKDMMYESNFKILNNESTLLFYKDSTPVNIIGTNVVNNIEELLTKDTEYNYSILLTHKPDIIKKLDSYNIDLILSGHSLGGIINVPFYEGIIKRKGASYYLNSYYKVNNTDLYISNGIGCKDFEFRLFNNPSVNVYRFSI